MERIWRNYIRTRGEPKIFYRKSTGILSRITSGNIKKERLKLKELAKGNKWGLGVLKDFTAAVINSFYYRLFLFFSLKFI